MRRGWCPGALRPMQSGDGYILRLRPRGPALPGALLACLADLADRYGSGYLDLTSRANLQLRGVAAAALSPLQAALDALGLLDPSEAREARRNILLSPLAGLDPTAVLDLRALHAALDFWLAEAAELSALPGKFGFGLDDGGLLRLSPDASDLHGQAIRHRDGTRIAVFAGGVWLTTLDQRDFLPALTALTTAFLRHAAPGERMRALVARIGASGLLAAAGVTADSIAPAMPGSPSLPRLGAWPLQALPFLLVGVPFGRMSSAQARLLADLAPEIRLTPWRCLALPHALTAADRLADAGFLLTPDAPLYAVAACPGAPACASGTTPTQADATVLADLLPPNPVAETLLHVSGCAKGCAHPRRAPITLVARDGAYDVVLNGTAADPPAVTGLDLPNLRAFLSRQFSSRHA